MISNYLPIHLLLPGMFASLRRQALFHDGSNNINCVLIPSPTTIIIVYIIIILVNYYYYNCYYHHHHPEMNGQLQDSVF